MEKVQWNSIDKKHNGLKYSKNDKSSTLPRASMERRKAGTKERNPNGLSLPNQNTILMNIIWYYFARYGKKYNEIQLTKNKMDSKPRHGRSARVSACAGLTNQFLSCWVLSLLGSKHWYSNCRLPVDGGEGTPRPCTVNWCKKVG